MNFGNSYVHTVYRKQAKQMPNQTLNYNADDVWAAASQAQRINGAYVKQVDQLSDGAEPTARSTNRQIMTSLLEDTSMITDEDRARGRNVRKYYQAFSFKILKGQSLSEFNNHAMTVANREVITSSYDFAVICSLPASYEKSALRDDAERRINFARGGFLQNVGDKISVTIEVLKKVWSQKYNIWYLTGITSDDKVVFFAFKKPIEIASTIIIEGKVKARRDASTQLSHVKVKP